MKTRIMGMFLALTMFAMLLPATANAENIELDSASIEFTLPEIGQTIVVDAGTSKQTPQLSFSVASGEHYSISDYDENNKMLWVDSNLTPLNNVELESNTDYKVVLGLEAEDGYCFAAEPVIRLNGKDIDGVIAQNGDNTKIYVGYTFGTPGPTVYYDVWVAGTQVTSDNAADILGDGNASYNIATNTLTLDNATVTASGTGTDKKDNYGIYSPDALNIVAKGASAVSGKNDAQDSCGIYGKGIIITLTDGATLTAKGGSQTAVSASSKSYGLMAENADIEIKGDGTVSAIGGIADESYGVNAAGYSIVITGGTLSARANGTGSVALSTDVAPTVAAGNHLVLTAAADGSSVYTVKPDTYYNIIFDENGGDTTPPPAVTDADGKLTSLPIITRNDYDFRGWYTASVDGTPITKNTVFTTDTVIFAHWEDMPRVKNRSSAHSINVTETENGSVAVSSKSALSGNMVVVSVTPDEGYVLDKITVTDQTGREIPTTKTGDKYAFVMTEDVLRVTPVFAEEKAEKPKKTVSPFYDITYRDYFYNAVLWAADAGIASGTTERTFSPNDSCTRAQTVTFLWRAAGSPEPIAQINPFIDVKKSDYFYNAVLWAYENGITSGTSYNVFSPYDTVTRAQTVTFLYRFAGEKTKNKKSFADITSNEYYYDAVFWAYENDIASGTSDETFSPDEDCLRGQIVTFLYRYYC